MDKFNNKKITAVIPVRKGSTRCVNKNIRQFGDTNLLKLRIETLKRVNGIDKILVSSNCDEMLLVAKNLGVDIHKRDEIYATSNCTGSDLNKYLASEIDTEYFMRVSAMTPFIEKQFEECIEIFRKAMITKEYDSVNTVNISQHFTWEGNKPINYNYDNEVPSFELPKWYVPNFGINIIETKNAIKYKNIIGKKPYFFKTDLIEGIDIDYPSDFINSELLYINNIINEDIANLILEKRSNDTVELLDCTIRDGGYLNNWSHSIDQVKECYNLVTKAGYDYFEIGFKSSNLIIKNKGKWYYSTEEDVNSVKKSVNNGCKIAVLLKPGEINLDEIPLKKNSKIDMYRVLINRSNQKMSENYSFYTIENVGMSCVVAQELIDKGYEVTINIGCFDCLTDTEINLITNYISNVKGLKAVYLADTYGSANSKNIPIQLHKFYTKLNFYKLNIRFGFHCHNNNEDSLSKTKLAVYHGCTMIDSSIGGLGRGAGNLKSEQIMSFICNDIYEYIERIRHLISYYDKYILSKENYRKNNFIFSHPYHMISGYLSMHPNYIDDLLNQDSTINDDIDMIYNIYKYSESNNFRNYDKNLINSLYSSNGKQSL